MSFLPFIHPLIILVLAVAALVVIWWVRPGDDPSVGRSRWPYVRHSAMVLLLALGLLRPGVEGGDAPIASANVNVYFVVDTTPSMLAEDYNNNQPRMDGVRSDIGKIVQAIPGARFSVITFDRTARVRVPLTSDTTAIQASVETLRTESPTFSQGSSITGAREKVTEYMQSGQKKTPERGRILVYLGDGEQTSQNKPEPFSLPDGLADSAVVLGYGSPAGGAMKVGGSDPSSSELKLDPQGYLIDPKGGQRARSVMDENNLKRLAEQLHGTYEHRDSLNAGVDDIVAGFDTAQFGASEDNKRERIAARRDFYWVPMALAGLVGAWEMGLALAALRTLRRREQGRTA